jgi:hypothetical protein
MRARVTRPWVIDGIVRWPGETIETNRANVERLERLLIVERFVEDWAEMESAPEFQDLPEREKLRDVLVFTPVLRLESRTVEALMRLEFDGALTLMLQRDNPSGDGRQDHLHQYRRARRLFLQGPYDAMLVVESDIVPPPDTLARLEALNADCAYGVYRFRAGGNVINIFERYPGQARNVGQSLSVKPHLLRRAVQLGKYPCSGAGLGCILIRRMVLEQVDFRLEKTAHCDTYFTQDIFTAGFSQRADMRVICGHVTETGEVLWPEI